MVLLLADLIVLLHFAFVAFVVAGGLLALRWPRAAWLHLPAVAWGAAVEFKGWICPLTPLENRLRGMGGADSHGGDFIARHLLPLLYPAGLTPDIQILLGIGVLATNTAIYAWVLYHRFRRS
ncbi:MAG: DUF2784 domain-containing protein [Sulfurisoma sp.]|nr:DUF2784 domain-containing protein [Sulfurisoma sp.]